MAKVFVTGAAGFIGFHICRRLLARGDTVVGVDNLSDYYDVGLKNRRLALLLAESKFTFQQLDIANEHPIHALIESHRFDAVIHMAAQAGVRYSLTNPRSYIDANLVGFNSILEGCRHYGVKHLVYASSSSVYGANSRMPFSVHDNVDHPLSLYAATKKANELMAHSYSHLFKLPTTGLRFFTVYGPWGRPDMAMFKFTKAILAGEPIELYNHGQMKRDFTFIDDIVEGVIRVADQSATPDARWSASRPDPGTSSAPYRIYNIGNSEPVELLRVIAILERLLGKQAERKLLAMQPGDVPATFADVSDLTETIGFKPLTPVEVGIERFVEWYREYYQV